MSSQSPGSLYEAVRARSRSARPAPVRDDLRGRASAKARRAGSASLLALPGALTVYFAFNAGGFFPGSQGFVAVLLALALVLRVTVAKRPFEGFSAPLVVALGAIALYAAWVLGSALWSDAPARALLEFDRALLYGMALALMGSVPRSSGRVAWCVRGLAAGIALVCLVALTSRVLPEVLSTAQLYENERLSYPLTYWNALGMLAAIGLILCLHLASSLHEPSGVRVLSSALTPVLGATLLLTFSRGAIVAAILGLVAYVALGRPRALVGGLLGTIPATAAAVIAAYDAELLATVDPTIPEAIAQGKEVALVVALSVIGAALVRSMLLPLDRLQARRAGWLRMGSRVKAVAAATALVLVGVGAVALELPEHIGRQYDSFLTGDVELEGDDDAGEGLVRNRLSSPGSNGRVALWEVARDGFAAQPFNGQGAGTYQVLWARDRPFASTAVDAHSLYIETLAELGLVGLALLLAGLLAIVGGLAKRMSSRRSLYAALLGAALAWALHAGIDWDWEMPSVTIWLFAIGGIALAARPGRGALGQPGQFTRVAIAAGLLALAVTPTLVAISQSRVDAAVAAFRDDDCGQTIDAALASSSAVGVRPEPFELLGYCDSRLGLHSLAIGSMESAIERDPGNWEFRYGLALVTAAAGRDPRPAASAAHELNPMEPIVRDLLEQVQATSDPREWRRLARAAPLPFDGPRVRSAAAVPLR